MDDLTEEQISMLAMSYGLEQLLLDHDIEQEYVIKLLIEEEILKDLGEYFDKETTRI